MATADLIVCSPKFRALLGGFDEETRNRFDNDIFSMSIFEEIVGSSEAICRVTAQVLRVAPSNATVLDRPEDTLLFAKYFIERYAAKEGKRIRRVEKRTAKLLEGCHWPGNIRELQNVIERAMIFCDSDMFFVEEAWWQPEAEPSVGLQPSLINQEQELIRRRLRRRAAAFLVERPKGYEFRGRHWNTRSRACALTNTGTG